MTKNTTFTLSTTDLAALAVSPACPADLLDRIASGYDKDLKHLVATNPATPVKHLRRFARMRTSTMRLAVAQNPAAPVKVLDRLRTDDDAAVRRAVLGRDDIPKAWLLDAATDPDVLVAQVVFDQGDDNVRDAMYRSPHQVIREQVAQSTNPDTLRNLLDVTGLWQLHLLVQNPACPADVLDAVAAKFITHGIRGGFRPILEHPNATKDVLARFQGVDVPAVPESATSAPSPVAVAADTAVPAGSAVPTNTAADAMTPSTGHSDPLPVAASVPGDAVTELGAVTNHALMPAVTVVGEGAAPLMPRDLDGTVLTTHRRPDTGTTAPVMTTHRNAITL